MGRRLDDARPDHPLSALGNLRHRQRTADKPAERTLVPTLALRTLARRQRLIIHDAGSRRQRPKKKKPLRGCGWTGAGVRGFRGRGGGGGDSADEVVSELAVPSSGSLTDSSKFDSWVRQR
mgnify:CR=1 FL=1